MAIQVRVPGTRWIPDLTGTGMETIFYPWVTPVPNPNRDGYGVGIFSHPQVTRRVPDTLLPLWFYVVNKWKCVHFVILTMTYSDCWTLLLGYLKYLLNINFEHVYIVFYSLNWLFWCRIYMWNDKPDGYPKPDGYGYSMNFYPRVWVRVWIFTRSIFAGGWIIALPDPNPTRCHP
jgi:hypothetical protein